MLLSIHLFDFLLHDLISLGYCLVDQGALSCELEVLLFKFLDYLLVLNVLIDFVLEDVINYTIINSFVIRNAIRIREDVIDKAGATEFLFVLVRLIVLILE